MPIVKQILLTLLTVFTTVATFCGFVQIFRCLIGGAEFHAIFAYSDGGRLNVAAEVYAADVAVMSSALHLCPFPGDSRPSVFRIGGHPSVRDRKPSVVARMESTRSRAIGGR